MLRYDFDEPISTHMPVSQLPACGVRPSIVLGVPCREGKRAGTEQGPAVVLSWLWYLPFNVLSLVCYLHVVPAAGSSQWWVHTCHVLVHVAPCLAAVGTPSLSCE
jgi:hypothetical protein